MDTADLIFDKRKFSFLKRECEKIIDAGKRLPDFVFKRAFANYFAIEYGYLHRKEFAALLSWLSVALHDEWINYMSLDPDSVEWYQEKAFFGLVSFKPSTVADQYAPGMSWALKGANIGVFWGSSLEWGIFCDRISWELAVIAAPTPIDVRKIGALALMDPSSLSRYMTSQYRIKDPSNSIASDFTRRFLANYRI